MWRWVLQTVRVAVGCDSLLPRYLSSSRTTSIAFTGDSIPLSSKRCLGAQQNGMTRIARQSFSLSAPLSTTSMPLAHDCLSFQQEHGITPGYSADTISLGFDAVDNETALGSQPNNSGFANKVDEIHEQSIAKLRIFLSDAEQVPQRYTVRDIRHRYVLWKSNAMLHKLSSRDMSMLMSLLGTLSFCQYGDPLTVIHTHPRALEMPRSNFAPHWHFIEHIVTDKIRLHYPVTPSDRYWLMRVHLAKFTIQVQSDQSKAKRSLSKANKIYLSLCEASAHPDIHIPILRALIASPWTHSARDLVNSFVSLLGRDQCHVYVVKTLFEAVLRRQHDLVLSFKQEILRGIARRISTLVENDSQDSVQKLVHPIPAEPSALGVDISGLVSALEDALFSSGRIRKSHPYLADTRISHWARITASRVFATDYDAQETVELRWNSLMLFAIALTRSSDWKGNSAAKSRNSIQHAAVVEWQMICTLAAMESLFRTAGNSRENSFGEDVVRSLSNVVRSVWQEWTAIHPSITVPRSIFVTRLICASFFRLAGHLKDKALVNACREHSVEAGLWSMNLHQPHTEAGLHELAAEQLYASLECGVFFERALVDLMLYASHVRTLRGAVDTALLRYSRSDPEHAQELVAWASSRNVVPTASVIADVGIALANRGIGDYMEQYLNDARLTSEQRASVASVYLRMYVRYGRRFMDPIKVANTMNHIFFLIPQVEKVQPLLTRLQSSLLVLIRHQHSGRVVAVIQDVAARHPSLFPATFYTGVLRALLRHRQFKLSQHVLIHALQQYPEMAQRWTALMLFSFHRSGSSKLASKLTNHTTVKWSASLATLTSIARTVRFRGRSPDSIKTLGLIRIGVTSDDPYAWRHTVNLLARAGRLHAAKQFFATVYARMSPEFRTSLGNAILHGYLLRRSSSNRQRLRAVADTYRSFVKEYAFAPDHVTVNILIKAQLRSLGAVDAGGVRRLFDALVRWGYPTGTRDAGHDGKEGGIEVDMPPFGANGGPLARIVLGKLELPRVEVPLSFRRHVEPMYRTFIKAFYQRGDVQAARRVVGILQVLQAKGWGRRRPGRGGEQEHG